MIETENFSFIPFDLENSIHKEVAEELIGPSKSSYVKQVEERIKTSRSDIILGNAFLVFCKDLPIGYMYLSSKPKDYLFIDVLLIKEARSKGYGSNLLREIEEYLFQNYTDLREIRLDIDNSNIASQKSAEANGYFSDYEDLDNLTNPTSLIYKKFNPYYKKNHKK